METFHYTMADPQMVPVDLLDVILPEDIYRLNYSYNVDPEEFPDDDDDDVDDSKEEQGGILATFAKAFYSPFSMLYYLFELVIERALKRTNYEQHE